MSSKKESTLLYNNLTEWERNFIESVRLYLKDERPGSFEFRYFDHYIGVKLKGNPKFPFLFKKPKNTLIFRSQNGTKKDDLEITKSNVKTFSLVVGQIIAKPKEPVVRDKVKKASQETKRDKFLSHLNEKQVDFIAYFTGKMRSTFPKTLRFRNKRDRFDIVTYKGANSFFMFKLVGEKLAFHNVIEDHIIVINDLNQTTFDSVLNSAINVTEKYKKGTIQAINNFQDSETPNRFTDALEQSEKNFIGALAKIIKEYYGNDVDPVIGETFVSFKDRKNERALFWFMRKNDELTFESHPRNEDVRTIPVVEKDRNTLLICLGASKHACDTYGLISNRQNSKQPVAENKPISAPKNEPIKENPIAKSSTPKIYSFIRDEFRNKAYNALPSFRALCRNIKSYFLDVVNKERKIKFTNATEACESALFFKNSISWTDKAWLNSARIVYSYFKANTLVEKIQYYEEIKQAKMCEDYDALLKYFYSCIFDNAPIDYSKAPSITKDFASLSTEPLKEILENFESYEQE